MNCPKCNSPVNEGDKFCQVCGAVLGNNQASTPASSATPTVNNQPVGMNQPVKKNNSLMYLLIIIVVVLAGVIVFLLLNNGEDKNSNNNSNEGNGGNQTTDTGNNQKEPEAIPVNSTETTINGYKLKLPSGYNVEEDDTGLFVYDDNLSVQMMIVKKNGLVSSLSSNVEGVKDSFTKSGMTDIQYSESEINGKKMLSFTGKFSGYDYEVIFVQTTYNQVLCAEVAYISRTTTQANEIYQIVGSVSFEEAKYGANSQSPFIKVSLDDILNAK